MKKLATLNLNEQITLFQLVQLNKELLTDGFTKERLNELTVLQFELIEITQKFSK